MANNEKPTDKVRSASMREMKISVVGIIILCFTLLAFGQGKPLTQAEYVKMLYGLQKSASGKAAIVEALRKRGIDFVVTDGIRSLTRSKGSNDDELKRALEEADRRRQNPDAAKLPTQAESDAILAKAREATLQALEEMPDFVVKQRITRSEGFAGTGNLRGYSSLVMAVSYSTEKGEQYQPLVIDGARVNAVKGGNYGGLDGVTSSGEFVDVLETIFKPENKATFSVLMTDVIRGQQALVYEFAVSREFAKNGILVKGYATDSIITGIRGRLWIGSEANRVLRIESEAADIPNEFVVRSAVKTIDYDWVVIAGEKYLLPLLSDVRMISRESNRLIESRNLIRFREYQKYGSDVRILDDDIKPEPEPTPVKP